MDEGAKTQRPEKNQSKPAKTTFGNRRFSESVRCAQRGVTQEFKSAYKPRLYVCMLLASLVECVLFHANEVQAIALFVTAMGALSAELLNSAIEQLADVVSPGYDKRIGRLKDISAGAVLMWGYAFWGLCLYVPLASEFARPLAGRCLCMLLTLLPILFGGVTNMLFVRTALYQRLRTPIDLGLKLRDGRPLFGNNKTYIGLASMCVACAFWYVVLGFAYRSAGITGLVDIYAAGWPADAMHDAAAGFLLGLAYMVGELPNSFIKRRMGVEPGESVHTRGLAHAITFVLDNADSALVVSATICVFGGFGLITWLQYVAFASALHLATNLVLAATHVREDL